MAQSLLVHEGIDTADASPLRKHPYRVSTAERSAIIPIIPPVCSPKISSSPPRALGLLLLLSLRKKDGSWRFCVDYRHLDSVRKKDVCGLPKIDDMILFSDLFFV